jgi:hypothetical protein
MCLRSFHPAGGGSVWSRRWTKNRQFCEGYFEITRLIVSLTHSFPVLSCPSSLTLIDIQTLHTRPQPWHHHHPYTYSFVNQKRPNGTSSDWVRLYSLEPSAVCVLCGDFVIQFSNCGNFVLSRSQKKVFARRQWLPLPDKIGKIIEWETPSH